MVKQYDIMCCLLVITDGLLTIGCIYFGFCFIYHLYHQAPGIFFRFLSIITIILCVLNAIFVFINFIVLVHFDWTKTVLQDALAVPWRICYLVSGYCVLMIFVCRLYVVFDKSIYAYSNQVFYFLGGMLTLIAIFGITGLGFQVAQNLDAAQPLAFLAKVTYVITSIIVLCLFIRGLFKVKWIFV